MKKNQLNSIIFLLLMAPVMLFAQTHSIDKIYEKYAGKEGFTSINISSEMFRLAASLSASADPENAEDMNEILAQLKGMKILVYNQAKESINAAELKREIQKTISSIDFSELMTVEETDSKVRFLTKSGPGGKISEMIMVAEDGNEIVVMSFTGLIDLETIGKISRSMNVQGMDKLDKLNDKE
jgi:hypothetical protein